MSSKKYVTDLISANQSNCKRVAGYFKYNWLKGMLTECGVDLSECYPEGSDEPEDQTPMQKNKLRMLLRENNITVLDNFDDEVQILVENELIAHWLKPVYDLREDLTKINPKDRLYVGINLKYWSVFDNN